MAVDKRSQTNMSVWTFGGELGSCLEIVGLFEKAGYKIETTAAQSSNQNRPGEQLHQTIADALTSIGLTFAITYRYTT
jgi:hypothetical protein